MTSSRKVAVVNEAFVREFLPDEKRPDSRTFSFDDSKPEGGEPTYIVGVVRDIRHKGIQKSAKPTVYVAIDQVPNPSWPTILVRSQAPPMSLLAPIYRELGHLGPSVAIGEFGTLRQQVDDSIFEQRMLAALGAFFGTLALVLAAVGLYGVVAYGTARRTLAIGHPSEARTWTLDISDVAGWQPNAAWFSQVRKFCKFVGQPILAAAGFSAGA